MCTDERGGTELVDMAAIRWYQMSRALSELGHTVDIVHGRYKRRLRQPIQVLGPRLREVPLSKARWPDYDVVKTLFHRGFKTLDRYGGLDHPFIISKLGSVVASEDREGIYFYGSQRERAFRIQARMHGTCRYISLLTEPAASLWRKCHGDRENLLIVPGAADADIPAPGPDPYPRIHSRRVLFAGNFYHRGEGSQPEAHRTITAKLNALGQILRRRDIGLFVIGRGEVESLDPSAVHYLGAVTYEASWDYLRHADVGLVVSAGPFMHNNESTKIYSYLRVGLPTVSESGFPNDYLIRDTGHGSVVEPGDMEKLAAAVELAAGAALDRGPPAEYILRNHTWSKRAEQYDVVIRRHLDG